MNIKVLLIHMQLYLSLRKLDFNNCFSLIYNRANALMYASSPQVFEVPLILPHLPLLFTAHFQPSLTGTDQVYDLQKGCSSVAVICGEDDIRQKVNVLCLPRYLRTVRLTLLLSSDEEVCSIHVLPADLSPCYQEREAAWTRKAILSPL